MFISYCKGPNPKFPPSGLYHWFDGDGMVHSMHIKDGIASYSNHQTRTKKVRICFSVHSRRTEPPVFFVRIIRNA